MILRLCFAFKAAFSAEVERYPVFAFIWSRAHRFLIPKRLAQPQVAVRVRRNLPLPRCTSTSGIPTVGPVSSGDDHKHLVITLLFPPDIRVEGILALNLLDIKDFSSAELITRDHQLPLASLLPTFCSAFFLRSTSGFNLPDGERWLWPPPVPFQHLPLIFSKFSLAAILGASNIVFVRQGFTPPNDGGQHRYLLLFEVVGVCCR
jgi:hypothetical protein